MATERVEHEHDDAHEPTVGDRDVDRQVHVHRTEAPVARPVMAAGVMAMRMLLTLLGTAGLIVGAMLEWVRDLAGTELSREVYYRANVQDEPTFVQTAGVVMVALGLLGLIGLATQFGWLIRLAGALGIAGFALFLIQLYRADGLTLPEDVGLGAWIVLTGAIVMVIAGFVARPRTVVVTRNEDTVVE